MDFQSFQKIPRLSRDMIITEKLDGTNAQVAISDDSTFMKVGSRNKWLATIYPTNGEMQWDTFTANKAKPIDNYGFARWAYENREELFKLGPGRHYGEWWGQGIQRGYNLQEKKFSLFNVHRWYLNREPWEALPSCVSTVPILYMGEFDTAKVEEVMDILEESGSVASPGYMNPEGIIIFHEKGALFKKTFEGDLSKFETNIA